MNDEQNDPGGNDVPQYMKETQEWVEEQLSMEAVAAEVVRLEEMQAMEKRLRKQIQGIMHRLTHSISMLRAVVLDNLCHQRFPEDSKAGDGEMLKRKRQILVELLDNHDARVGLGFRVGHHTSKGQKKSQTTRVEDCDNRLEICRAACCRLPFALTESEVRDGSLQWSIDHPFVRSAGKDGYCVYLDRDTMKCTIYEQRPAVCRNFLCRKDKRIWEDYDEKEIAPALGRTLKKLDGKTPIIDPVTSKTESSRSNTVEKGGDSG